MINTSHTKLKRQLLQTFLHFSTYVKRYIFYPFYRNLGVTTTYEYIDRRYGRPARYAVSGLFCLARLGWLGVVIYSPSLALSVVTGMNLSLCILLIGTIATAYAMLGGISAVIWTDVLQVLVLMGGAIVCLIMIITNVDGGLGGLISVGLQDNKFETFDWGWDHSRSVVWVMVPLPVAKENSTPMTPPNSGPSDRDIRQASSGQVLV